VRLRQILFNLLSNAIKFTERGAVAVSLEPLGEGEAGQQLRLAVVDTGIGISDAQQTLLFRPFSQAQTSISRRYGGSGLGLSICRRLVDMMGGSIALQSQPGLGTRVEVVLTLAAADGDDLVATDAVSGEVAAFRPGLRVLVVEDHPTNQALMRWRMERLGLDCHIVDEGEAALASLREERFDLVVTDCHMPGMDGYAFVRALRERERVEGMPRMPVIAVTASALSDDAARCIEAGMDECLIRPVPFDALSEALQRWLPTEDAMQVATLPAESESPEETAAWPDAGTLRDSFGEVAAARIVETLRLAMRKDLDALERAVERADAAGSAELLHRMAGAVAVAGASQLAERARSLSQALASGSLAADGAEPGSWLVDAHDYLRHLDAVAQALAGSQSQGVSAAG
jgi:two-component system sensor histidine kinase EvgS